MSDKSKDLTAAAEVGEYKTADEKLSGHARIVAATIERCARVVENYDYDAPRRLIAAAIRALKEEG